MVPLYMWVAFVCFLLVFLLIDLGLHGGSKPLRFREALAWTCVWVTLALSFAGFLWFWRGGTAAGQFVAGYLIEWSLSVDNVFVFLLIFSHFRVPPAYQHRVLFWGVLGAIVMRLSFILAGAVLIERFHAVIYVFGAILIFTAVRFVVEREREQSLEETRLMRLVGRVLPVTATFNGQRFLTREDGRLRATPLLAALVVVELTDVVFAVDSIPAVFAVTRDAFIAFTSNAMAILGLRSLYFLLSGAMHRFRYMRPSLAAILAFVGVKMLISGFVHIPVGLSLAVIIGILSIGLLASLRAPTRQEGAGERDLRTP